MTSKKQIAANHRNAEKSAGPKSKTGLMVVSQNALTYGFDANTHIVLSGESQEEYDAMIVQMEQEFQVTTWAEKALVKKMVDALWKKQRLQRVENSLIQTQVLRKSLEITETQEEKQQSERIANLKNEIEFLKDGISDIEGQLKEAKRINRIKDQDNFQEEAKAWVSNNWHEVKYIFRVHKEFMFYWEKEDASKHFQVTESGRYSANLCRAVDYLEDCYPSSSTTYYGEEDEDDDNKEDEETEKPANIEAPLDAEPLKEILKILTDRLKAQESKLEEFYKLQEVEKQIQLAGTDMTLKEEEAQKLQRYDILFDGQFYRALTELQKLQVFLIKKKEVLQANNGFVPQNDQFSHTIETNCS